MPSSTVSDSTHAGVRVGQEGRGGDDNEYANGFEVAWGANGRRRTSSSGLVGGGAG